MLTYQQARAIVDAYGPPEGARWFSDEVLDRPGYWFFHVGFIGSKGVIVDKATGTLTPVGSAFELDDWLWGYENNFLLESATLRVLSVVDFERTLQVLQSSISAEFRWRYELRNWLKQRLQSLPAEFPSQNLTLSIPSYRAAIRDEWFTFEVLAA